MPSLLQVLVDFLRVFTLATQDVSGQIVQCVPVWVKPKTEDIRHFAPPQGCHFNSYEDGQIFVQCKLLKHGDGIRTIVIGDSNQAKPFIA